MKKEGDVNWTPPDEKEEQKEEGDGSDGGHHEAPEEYDNGVSEDVGQKTEQGIEPDNEKNDNACTSGVSLGQEMYKRYGKRTGTYNLRPKKKPVYDLSSLAQVGEEVIAPTFNPAGLASLDSSIQPLLNFTLTHFGIQKEL